MTDCAFTAPAVWYDGVTALRHEGEARWVPPGTLVLTKNGAAVEEIPFADLEFAEALPDRQVFTRASLPDFRLQAVAGAGAARILRVKRASDAEQMLALPERPDRAKPVEFEVDGRHYVLEFNRTVLEHRALTGDELVVWPREEYRAALGTHATR